jgi:dipeptidyl aminopeptidase/acylaminoacyl peptidase
MDIDGGSRLGGLVAHPMRRFNDLRGNGAPPRWLAAASAVTEARAPTDRGFQMRSLPWLLAICFALTACAAATDPHAETLPHPDRRDAVVEYFVRKPGGAGPWPTVVFLHGHQDGAGRIGGLAFVRWGVLDEYARRGYLAVSVSLPGYGGSSGPEDFAGPFTQDAVAAVIQRIEADKLALPGKVVIEGVSLGAVTAALLAGHDSEASGLVLISGLYDLPAFFDRARTPAAEAVRAAARLETGGAPEALRARSALYQSASIKAPVLILNGALDDRTDPDQARRFAALLDADGGHAQVHVYPQFGHEIPVGARQAEVDAFIDRVLKQ